METAVVIDQLLAGLASNSLTPDPKTVLAAATFQFGAYVGEVIRIATGAAHGRRSSRPGFGYQFALLVPGFVGVQGRLLVAGEAPSNRARSPRSRRAARSACRAAGDDSGRLRHHGPVTPDPPGSMVSNGVATRVVGQSPESINFSNNNRARPMGLAVPRSNSQ